MSAVKDLSLTNEVDKRLDELFSEDEESAEKPDLAEPVGNAESSILGLKTIVLAIDWEITDGAMTRLIDEIEKVSDSHQGNKHVTSMLRLLKSLAKYIRKRKGRAHPDSIKLLHSAYQGLETIVTGQDLTKKEVRAIVSGEVDNFRELKNRITIERSDSKDADPPPATLPPPVETGRVSLEETVPYYEVDEHIRNIEVRQEEPQPVLEPEPENPESSLEEDGAVNIPAGAGLDALLDLDDLAPPKDLAEMTPHEAFAFALDEIRATIKAEFRALRAELTMWRMNQ